MATGIWRSPIGPAGLNPQPQEGIPAVQEARAASEETGEERKIPSAAGAESSGHTPQPTLAN